MHAIDAPQHAWKAWLPFTSNLTMSLLLGDLKYSSEKLKSLFEQTF
jgi:hypothetical protein